MSFRLYLIVWLVVSFFLLFEYSALNHAPQLSLIAAMKAKHIFFSQTDISTRAGRPISYFLGWAGFLIMLVTNAYVLRKRLPLLSKVGSLKGWLDFHVFCGLLGPVLLIFHSDFQVGGLVAISFWSMIIVTVSGVLGRYFYLQILKSWKANDESAGHWERQFDELVEAHPAPISGERIEAVKYDAVRFAGAHSPAAGQTLSALPLMLCQSLLGDLRLCFSDPWTLPELPQSSRKILRRYATHKRVVLLNRQFQRLFGYWHSFHIPFTLVMYFTALIHIVVALLFQVN